MGAIQNSINAALGVAGVASRMIDRNISEANDANKNQQMRQKATRNKDALVKMKSERKKLQAAAKDQNKDIKTQIAAKELMRMK